MSDKFAELFEASYNPTLYTAGEIIPATVIYIEKDYIYLDAGTKSEAYVPIEQFKDENNELTVKIGDIVDMYLDMPVDGLGETRLDRDKAERIEALRELQICVDNETPVKGVVTHAVRAGLSLKVGKIKAFLPGSLIDTRGVESLEDFVNQTLEVRVLKIDSDKGNMIVSRRALLDEVTQAEKEEKFAKIEIGDIVEGTVKNLTDYGAFIDIGGIDGLLHITDMAWKRVNHPSEITKMGETIQLKVMKLDKDKCRLSLGLKQMQKDPWEDIEERFPIGTVIENTTVSNITDYGAFVAVDASIDGLVHTSELDWKNRNIHPSKVLSIGEQVSVKIISLDRDKRRFSLSIKRCKPNPWEEFSNNYKRGDKISGVIRSKTDFGLFVGLDGGIDGLIHATDLCWGNMNKEDELAKYHKDTPIEAIVLSMDVERERVSLGIKQLTKDEFNEFIISNNKGSIVSGKVISSDSKGAEVELADKVIGYLRKSEMLEDVQVDNEIEAVISNIDKKNRKISLSVKSKEEAEEKSALREYKKSTQEEQRNTIGDLLGEQLTDSTGGSKE
jgi:small subunit ribosomal protein S1